MVMNSKHIRADVNYAWPTAEIAVMGAKGNNDCAIITLYVISGLQTNLAFSRSSHIALTPHFHPSHTPLAHTPSHPSHTPLTPLSHPIHTPLTSLSHPSHTPFTPLSHPSHPSHTSFTHLSHTSHTPLSHPSHTPLSTRYSNSFSII